MPTLGTGVVHVRDEERELVGGDVQRVVLHRPVVGYVIVASREVLCLEVRRQIHLEVHQHEPCREMPQTQKYKQLKL